MVTEFNKSPLVVRAQAALIRFKITRGVDWVDSFSISENILVDDVPQEVPYDLTNSVIEILINPDFERKPLIAKLSSRKSEISIIDATSGIVQINIPASMTRACPISPPCGWAVELIALRPGEKRELARGRIDIMRGIME